MQKNCLAWLTAEIAFDMINCPWMILSKGGSIPLSTKKVETEKVEGMQFRNDESHPILPNSKLTPPSISPPSPTPSKPSSSFVHIIDNPASQLQQLPEDLQIDTKDVVLLIRATREPFSSIRRRDLSIRQRWPPPRPIASLCYQIRNKTSTPLMVLHRLQSGSRLPTLLLQSHKAAAVAVTTSYGDPLTVMHRDIDLVAMITPRRMSG